MALQYFGTDGIRGKAFEGVLSKEHLIRWGLAWSEVAATEKIKKIFIGRDSRVSSKSILEIFSHAVHDAIEIVDLGVIPTPFLSYEISHHPQSWGVMISASHNPPEDNGIKGFDHQGNKLPERLELALEKVFDSFGGVQQARTLPLKHGSPTHYIEDHPGLLVPDSWGLVIDCAHGSAAAVARDFFIGPVIHWIGTPADGNRINVKVGCTHLETVKQKVIETKSQMGIAFDGDGDRCLVVDESGTVFDGDQILWALVKERIHNQDAPKGVVGTLMTNGALEVALRTLGIPLLRTAVGDKHIHRELEAKGWDLGGEASGHIIQKRKCPTGDGIQTALSLLDIVSHHGFTHLFNHRFDPFPHRLLNLKTSQRRPLNECMTLVDAQKNVGRQMPDVRVVIRWSGTENLLRIMVESPSLRSMTDALEILKSAALNDLQ